MSASAAKPGCAVRLADGDGTVESDDRRVGESEQLVVPLQDLHPVGVLEERGRPAWSAAIAACAWYSPKMVLGEGGLQDGDASAMSSVSHRLRSCSARGTIAPSGRVRLRWRVVQQHQGEQTVDLGVASQRRQLPGEPDGLGGEVDVAGVALVEHEVQHSHHGSHLARTIETGPATVPWPG